MIAHLGQPDPFNPGTFYFLAYGRLFKAEWCDYEWAHGWFVEGAFKCTHCERDYAVDLMMIGAHLVRAGWTAEDLALIKALSNGEDDEIRTKIKQKFLQAFIYYTYCIWPLPTERWMIEGRRYYRRHLQLRDNSKFWW